MKAGDFLLLQNIKDSQPKTNFNFKKQIYNPAKVYEKNFRMIIAISFLIMTIHTLYVAVRWNH